MYSICAYTYMIIYVYMWYIYIYQFTFCWGSLSFVCHHIRHWGHVWPHRHFLTVSGELCGSLELVPDGIFPSVAAECSSLDPFERLVLWALGTVCRFGCLFWDSGAGFPALFLFHDLHAIFDSFRGRELHGSAVCEFRSCSGLLPGLWAGLSSACQLPKQWW